ncbi:MAG: hypothetical protein AAGA77_22675 [Bacteroidota bacterium]
MNVKKALVVLLVIHAILGVYFDVDIFFIPYWIRYFQLPGLFELSQTLVRLFRILSYVLTFIGVYRLISRKKIEIISTFKFPIYHFVASNVFWFLTTSLSTRYSFFKAPTELPPYYFIIQIISYMLLVLIIINYWNSKTKTDENIQLVEVSKKSRLINWILDVIFVFSFIARNIEVLMAGSIIDDIKILNSNPHWFVMLYLFWYFLVLELLFLQSIGKLHNNSTVAYNGNKFKSILIRTLCRLIPFEAFSFFLKRGWHDAISDTKVVVVQKH